MPGRHPVGAGVAVEQQRSGIGEAHRSVPVHPTGRGGEDLRLAPTPPLSVGEVGHQADGAAGGQEGQRVERRRQPLRAQAQAVHAGVHLDEQRQRPRRPRRAQHGDLLFRMDHAGQVVGQHYVEVGGLEAALQQQHRLADARLPQAHRLVQVQQGEAVGQVAPGPRRPHEAVAVGIGLHHRPAARLAGQAFGQQVVVAQGGRIDGGGKRARHVQGAGPPQRAAQWCSSSSMTSAAGRPSTMCWASRRSASGIRACRPSPG